MIATIKDLDNLKQLEVLHLRKNKITSLAGLNNLSFLSYLNLRDNQILDLSELEKLKGLSNLKTLILAGIYLILPFRLFPSLILKEVLPSNVCISILIYLSIQSR